MSEPKASAWAQARFTDAANDMAQAISRAVYQAHEQALAAHISGGLQSNDAYGATLHVAQYEQLAAECKDIPGVKIRKPKDVRCRFDLVVCEHPPVVVYPWRYAKDQAVSRDRARLRPPVSDLRKTLLALNENTISEQLTLEQGARDPEELEAELAEEQAILEQLATLGQVVTVGFASNPAGIFELGWGEVELTDEQTGEVIWRHWEPLPPPGDQTAQGEPRRPVSPAAGDDHDQSVRFDDTAPEDDLGLTLRPRSAEPPISEPERPQEDAGSDNA
ncbi:MAG TPA: hypothetical protein VFB06_06890 [Streptosporangiaceae bacterium]|nr:hypothetical protein [Streptosporangiaceae bacterium]